MTVPERLVVLFSLSSCITLVLGVWWGHVLTLRSWVQWWGDVSPFLRETVRGAVREELQRERDHQCRHDHDG